MTLGEKQELFARLLPGLINHALDLGYDLRLGDLFRDERVHGKFGEKVGYGAAFSCHKLKLAIDLNLFIDGRYSTGSEGHDKLGAWWVQQNPLCRWGGVWKDFNHYSLEHDGYR